MIFYTEFQFSINQKDRSYIIPIMWLNEWLTNVKPWKQSFFAIVDPKSVKSLILISFKCSISSYIGLKFPITFFYNHNFPAFKCIPHANNEKKPIGNASFFGGFFSQHWTYFHPIFAKTVGHIFADFQWNMLGDSININDLCCNPLVLKTNW